MVDGMSAKSHGSRQPSKYPIVGRKGLQAIRSVEQLGEVAGAAALRDQASARHQRAADTREQQIVIEDPVESGRAQHRVEGIHERKVEPVGADELDA